MIPKSCGLFYGVTRIFKTAERSLKLADSFEKIIAEFELTLVSGI